jgi:hypothetical protein
MLVLKASKQMEKGNLERPHSLGETFLGYDLHNFEKKLYLRKVGISQ